VVVHGQVSVVGVVDLVVGVALEVEALEVVEQVEVGNL
jgi:hypothetical protein